VPGDTGDAVFVRDRQTGTTERVDEGYYPAISADGRFVAFTCDANILVRDRQKGTTELASVATDGNWANADSYPAISADGRFVAFASEASNLVPGDRNGSTDVFVRDRQTGTMECVSVAVGGAPAGADWQARPSISGDGRFVAFASWASDLTPGDTNGRTDVFVAERK
jgi:Tol biopolymer transport system component